MAGQNRDIQRLVYPPKVWVFVKLITGEVVDLTEYVIGGEVKRVIDSASSATLRLRNPNHLFTTHGNKHAILHPMDPITIYMQRFNGRHVQVFTGYLDKTPYLQLMPDVVQIEATCTLKRLMFNYFQLAQIYTIEFFKHFGWVIQGNGTIAPANQTRILTAEDKEKLNQEEDQHQKEFEEGKIKIEEREEKNAASREAISKAGEVAKKAEEAQGKNQTPTTPFANPGGSPDVASDDGSFKKLLWAVLYYMADWKDENIYIEEMPKGIPELVAKLWTLFNEGERQEELEDLKAYWAQIIGVGSKGSGGGPGNSANNTAAGAKTGDLTNTTEVVATMAGIAEKYNLPPEFVIATSLCECSFNQKEVLGTNSAGATGWFQFTSSEPYPGIKVNFPSDAQDTGLATAAFCQGAVNMGHKLAGNGLPEESDWQHWAEETQQPGAGAYNESWARCLSEAKSYLRNYKPTKAESGESSTTQRSKITNKETGKSSTSSKTRLGAMEQRAEEITAKQYPYARGGGHPEAGKPSLGEPGGPPGSSGVLGFDCSGSVAAVLSAGGFVAKDSAVPGSGSFSTLNIPGWTAGEDTSPNSVNVFFNSEHAWMTIKGRYFSTGWNSNPNGGAGYGSTEPAQQPERGAYTVMHLSHKSLEETYTGPEPPPLSGEGSSEGLTGLGAALVKTGTAFGEATAADFLSTIQSPSTEEWTIAAAIGGQRALMNTTPVINLVQQIADSSLRKFMSLPNGDFYAFYPDYFGEFGQHEPYWKIHNIEVLEGTIELTDDNLVTHFFATGDVTWPANQKMVEEIYAGCMTIFEAFQPGVLLLKEQSPTSGNEPKQGRAHGHTKEAVAFLKRYGARPAKAEYPMVYSALFDQLIAYQQFLLGWARQFQSVFKFTFMPELFPGGKVAFPESGLKMYIEEVVHNWDIETSGFTTSALLTAPSVYKDGTNKAAIEELPERMVEALIEPQRGQIGKAEKGPLKPPPPAPPTPPPLQQKEEAFGPNFKDNSFDEGNVLG